MPRNYNHASGRSRLSLLWLALPAVLVALALWGLSKADSAQQSSGSMSSSSMSSSDCKKKVQLAMATGQIPQRKVLKAWWDESINCCRFEYEEI